MPVTSRAYHHGDLRRALLDASLTLVEESGIGALSLREVARKAGVSHNAPYHHFADKGALMAAIAHDGFQRLAAAMAAARDSVDDDDPMGRLEACGVAYVTFAVRSPAHFRVMFRPELADYSCHPELKQAATPPFETLVHAIEACQRAGVAPPGDPMPLVLTCWSAVHGLSALWLDGPLSQDPKGFGRDPRGLTAMVTGTIGHLLASGAPAAKAKRQRGSARR